MSKVTEIDAHIQRIQQQLNASKDKIKLDITSLYYQLQNAHSIVNTAQNHEKIAQKFLRLKHQLFQTGHARSQDLIDSQIELIQIQQ